jgi:hypothetical protein
MAAWIAGLRTARRRVIHIVRLRMRPGAPTLRTATGVSPLESAIAPTNRQRIRRFMRWDETGSRFNSGAAPATVSRNASVTAPLSSQLGKAIGAETYEPGDRPAGRNRRKAAALGILRESGARNPHVLGTYIPVPALRVHAPAIARDALPRFRQLKALRRATDGCRATFLAAAPSLSDADLAINRG